MPPVSVPATDPERSNPRASLCLLCEVRQGTRAWQRVVLEDLSATGFRIAGLADPLFDKSLSIRIPGLQLLSAQLRWQEGNMVGCVFTAPLHVAVFEHLVQKARGAF